MQGALGQSRVAGVRQLFSQEEDELLKVLVRQFGDQAWKKIAQQMPNRTPRQCRERYKNYLAPTIQNGPWTEAEDQLLCQKVTELGFKWSSIAKFFTSRSEVNIKNRWTSISGRTKSHAMARLDMPNDTPPEDDKPKAKQKLPPITSLDGFASRVIADPRDDTQDVGEDLSKTFPNYAGNFW